MIPLIIISGSLGITLGLLSYKAAEDGDENLLWNTQPLSLLCLVVCLGGAIIKIIQTL